MGAIVWVRMHVRDLEKSPMQLSWSFYHDVRVRIEKRT